LCFYVFGVHLTINCINRLSFRPETRSVYCAVRAEYLNINHITITP
jgi:hypothetical protein